VWRVFDGDEEIAAWPTERTGTHEFTEAPIPSTICKELREALDEQHPIDISQVLATCVAKKEAA
jgi:hypothetical protein